MNNFKRNIFRTAIEDNVIPINCVSYTVGTTSATGQMYQYNDCSGTPITDYVGGAGGYDANTFCAQLGSVTLTGNELTLVDNGECVLLELSINSSAQFNGSGLLDFANGESNEVLNLSFSVTPGESFVDLSFTAPVTVGSLEDIHLTRNGTIQLDINGNASSTYSFNPTNTNESSCVVTITGRSSSKAIPTINSTNF